MISECVPRWRSDSVSPFVSLPFNTKHPKTSNYLTEASSLYGSLFQMYGINNMPYNNIQYKLFYSLVICDE